MAGTGPGAQNSNAPALAQAGLLSVNPAAAAADTPQGVPGAAQPTTEQLAGNLGTGGTQAGAATTPTTPTTPATPVSTTPDWVQSLFPGQGAGATTTPTTPSYAQAEMSGGNLGFPTSGGGTSPLTGNNTTPTADTPLGTVSTTPYDPPPIGGPAQSAVVGDSGAPIQGAAAPVALQKPFTPTYQAIPMRQAGQSTPEMNWQIVNNALASGQKASDVIPEEGLYMLGPYEKQVRDYIAWEKQQAGG